MWVRGRPPNHRLHLTPGGGLAADRERPLSPAAGEAERWADSMLLARRLGMKAARPLLAGIVAALSVAWVLAGPPDLGQIHARGFEVTKIDGTGVPLTALLPANRPAVVEFWATWCTPCRKTAPTLQELSTRYGSTKLTVIGLTIEDPDTDRDKVEKFASEEGITYPLAFSPRELFQLMNEREELAVPKILVYDARGNVVEHITSYSFMTRRRLMKAVTRALGGK